MANDPGLNNFFSAVARAPMLRITVPFAAGIIVGQFWTLPLVPVVVVLALCTALWILAGRRGADYDHRWSRGLAAMLWFCACGLVWQIVRDPLRDPLHAINDGGDPFPRVVRITTINGVSEKTIRADAIVRATHLSDGLHPRTGAAMLTLLRPADAAVPVAGDELVIHSRLERVSRTPDPGGFDRRAWAASRGMYHETFAGVNDWAIVGHAWRWTDLFEPTRRRIAAWLAESGLPYRERALVKALVLGLRDELDHEQKDAFVKSGTIHVLAVSGTHVGFIYAMLLFLFGWWGGSGWARTVRGVVILLALWGYAGLTGACPSVLRATIMFSLFTLAGMGGRRSDPLNSLFAAAFLLLVWDPHMLVEIGFQLSFLAVLGIILFYAPILRLWVPNKAWVGHLWSLTVMSLAAQAITTPLSLYLFKAFPVWFLPANLIVVTAAGIAVYGAVALLVLFRIPFLGPAIVFLLTWLLLVVDKVTAWFASLPGAYPAIRATFLDMLLIYAVVLLVAVRWLWRWRPATRLALGGILLLLLGWGFQAHRAQDRISFTVYDDRRALQAAITVGRSITLLHANQDLDPWLAAKAERHARATGTNVQHLIGTVDLMADSTIERGGTCAGGGRWVAPALDVLFHTQGTPIDPGGRSDVVVITDLRYLQEEDLAQLARSTQHMVLAGGLPWKLRTFVQRWCATNGVPCHDVRDQGAFFLERWASN